jgi:predicted heme/steroid binding protein
MVVCGMRRFSKEELARYDGSDGAPAYVACNGEVYDVSNSYHWRHGRHHAMHSAGVDLTDSLRDAPHGAHLLDRVPVIGTLEDDYEDERSTTWQST